MNNNLIYKMKGSQLDPFSMQIIIHYFKYDSDFENIIQVAKKFAFLLDRLRINPIPLTKFNKRLFPLIETQQIFNEYEFKNENVDIYQINYPVNYKTFYDNHNKQV